ncbi:hypothetical protein LLEC1_05447 [Akanthomyces lecanii]|uniref:Aminoglycoside phosphotransferase domain-containing protein n=1 Tax=Cordyceps confragosa TaxID=2714763 RepID=A0A179IEQ0_CORDF|nr:hypothetical protein LLEC1_05447 [Akanthomyces lecanii]
MVAASVAKLGDHLHPTQPFHSCPRWQDADAYDPAARQAEECELARLINKIDTAALEARATRLRQGMRCTIEPLHYDRTRRSTVMGGMNYHVEIRFEDGIVWLARIRRFNATSPPPPVRDYIIESEVATLLFLEKTGVPAPKMYDYALEQPGNPVGVGFILMEKLAGKSLRWSLANEQQRQKVIDQISDILIELRKYPFPELGSLIKPGQLRVGPFAQESLTNVLQSGIHTIGPFRSMEDYHESSLSMLIYRIIQEEAYTEQAVDAYLVHRFLLDLVPLVTPPSSTNDEFYLKHADDKGDHILVDEEFNITGIVDWEWAHTAPASIAFNSPVALLPVADFYGGNNRPGQDELLLARLYKQKGQEELAQIVQNGRLQHRFAFCCGYDFGDWDGFLGLFSGLRQAVGVDAGMEWNEWKAVALDRYKDEPDLQVLLSR